MYQNPEQRKHQRAETFEKLRGLFTELGEAKTQTKRDKLKREIREMAEKEGVKKVIFPEGLQSDDDLRYAKEKILKKLKRK